MTRAALAELVLSCAPLIAPDTALALVQTESAGNRWAIGVVGNALTRQPRNAAEALATTEALSAQGWDYSVGLGQINRRNFQRLGLTTASAMDPCTNLRGMQTLMLDCFSRAGTSDGAGSNAAATEQLRLRRALSCYYSGNFRSGFSRDLPGQPAYVDRVIAAWSHNRTRGSPPH